MVANILTAKQIYTHMRQYVKGQDHELKQVASIIALHLQRISYNNSSNKEKIMSKANAIIVGPSGCGKTETFRALETLEGLDCPIMIANACDYVPNGWRGNLSLIHLIGTLVQKLMDEETNSNFNDSARKRVLEKAERAIICLDEFDKKRIHKDVSSDYNLSPLEFQSELLKLIEGNTLILKTTDGDPFHIRTDNMLFVLMGSFHDLPINEEESATMKFRPNHIDFEPPSKFLSDTTISDHQLIDYGIKEELVGRLPWRIRYNPLRLPDLVNIVENSKHSTIKEYQCLFQSMGHTLDVTKDAIHALAEEAIQRGTGARAASAIFVEIMEPVLFKLLSSTGLYVYVGGEEIVNRSVKASRKKKFCEKDAS